MIELSPQVATIIMFGGILVLVMFGFPLGFVTGTLALGVGFTVWGFGVGDVIYQRMFGFITTYVLLALPLFVFMGTMLEYSGITERLYDVLYVWLGGFRGGLAVVTVVLGTIIAATVGVIAASITMLTIVALPSMLKRGYSKSLAAGAVTAGGILGILIPPSIMLILYGPMAGVSVGKLFMGAMGPGFTLSALYISYISIRSFIQKDVAPPVPVEERQVPFITKSYRLLVALVPTAVLILAVLGVIFLGVAPPSEAAGVGAFASILLVAAYRRFSWRVLKQAALTTLVTSGYCALLLAMAVAFVSVFIGVGGQEVVTQMLLAVPGGKWGVFFAIMFIVFMLGMFIDWIGIILLMVPILIPVTRELGFDQVWFGIMICVNLQMAFMTPPVASGIFITKGACKPEWGVTMGDVMRGTVPFVGLVMIGLVLFAIFPQIVTWLPSQMIGR